MTLRVLPETAYKGQYLASLKRDDSDVWDLSTNAHLLVAQNVRAPSFSPAVGELDERARQYLAEDPLGGAHLVRRVWLTAQTGPAVWPGILPCPACKGTGCAEEECLLCHRDTCLTCGGTKEVIDAPAQRPARVLGVPIDLNNVALAIELAPDDADEIWVRTFEREQGIALIASGGRWRAFVMGLASAKPDVVSLLDPNAHDVEVGAEVRAQLSRGLS